MNLEAIRNDTIIGLTSIRLDDSIGCGASGRLIIPLGHARPVVANSPGQVREWFQFGPVLAIRGSVFDRVRESPANPTGATLVPQIVGFRNNDRYRRISPAFGAARSRCRSTRFLERIDRDPFTPRELAASSPISLEGREMKCPS